MKSTPKTPVTPSPRSGPALGPMAAFAIPLLLACGRPATDTAAPAPKPQPAATPEQAELQPLHLYVQGIHTATVEESHDGPLKVRERAQTTGRWGDVTELPASAGPEAWSALQQRMIGRLYETLRRFETVVWSPDAPVVVPVGDQGNQVQTRYLASQPVVTHGASGEVVAVRRFHHADGSSLHDGQPPIDVLVDAKGEVVALEIPSWGTVMTRETFAPLTIAGEWANGVSEAAFGVRKLDRQMVPMADGTKLATDIYLPTGSQARERFPVILTRTPYGIENMERRIWPLVARGYAFVAQDVRGRGESEGTWTYLHPEFDDGHHTLDWIAAQAWCDGNIGMSGTSYPGATQWMAAHRNHPNLKAIVPINTVGPGFADIPYTSGGGLMSGILSWGLYMDGGDMRRDDWPQIQKHRPLVDVDQRALGRESQLWNAWLAHPTYDDYWKELDWPRKYDITVPALHISGWYDDDGRGTLASWAAYGNRPGQHIILGPWRHGLNRDRRLNDIEFGPDSIRADLNLLILRWYDRHLKGMTDDAPDPVARYFATGVNEWREASAWPPREAKPQKWYLHGDGSARTGTGTLSKTAPGTEPPDAYTYDPANPTPSLIVTSLNENSLPDDYAEVEARDDVLVYTSEVLAEDVAIAGNITAVVHASSSARDTDFFAHLSDVDEQGRSVRLVEGMVRARYRKGTDRPRYLRRGKVEPFAIDLRAHAHVFRKGHRIRIAVASAAAGYMFPNSNTGKNEATVTTTKVARQRVFHDDAHPSHLVLPVMPQ